MSDVMATPPWYAFYRQVTHKYAVCRLKAERSMTSYALAVGVGLAKPPDMWGGGASQGRPKHHKKGCQRYNDKSLYLLLRGLRNPNIDPLLVEKEASSASFAAQSTVVGTTNLKSERME
jgi:hypothetical protein